MTSLTREAIMALIPHAGAMCLLDEVLGWDDGQITCLSRRAAAPDNPLRRAGGMLGAASGIEIAAQAMALHGRLTAPAGGLLVPGYLVALRDVHLRHASLDGPLHIHATRLRGDAQGAAYSFDVSHAGATILSGRATVLFGAPS